uniref:Mitogen-activated protein kinase kinase kinase N-terminal domain-containing protein n=1 Tax=Timema cristinae TaxID=61476 RepID=A0A7R9DLK7_TIMCR|nr:unnamed protein product [Timema cristinae]
MGSGDNKTDKNTRRHLSREEDMWQNELKDLIWLELQAWQADRTPREQDDYLCKAREKVADLLDEIINYRKERNYLRVIPVACDILMGQFPYPYFFVQGFDHLGFVTLIVGFNMLCYNTLAKDLTTLVA